MRSAVWFDIVMIGMFMNVHNRWQLADQYFSPTDYFLFALPKIHHFTKSTTIFHGLYSYWP